ncbi:MAG: DUF6029 family protein [Bacteroidetes bacterium]|nr:DUF6029 family protein [Bacteroidota bacterium]
MRQNLILVGIALCLAFGAAAQEIENNQGVVTGNVQTLWQSYSEDPLIGAIVPPEKTGLNSFGNLIYTQGGFSAGMRYESYLSAVLGFPGRFKGSGIGYRFARYTDETGKVDFTIGNFYEQFGSGIVLRAYEERALGIDNALDGIRIILRPVDGIEVKALYGKQRLDFDSRLINGPGTVRAIDGTIDVNNLFAQAGGLDWKTKWTIGASFVSKFQAGGTISKDSLLLQLPGNIGAWSYRLDAMRGGWSAGVEYAGKINDPSADNGYTYRNGEAILMNLGYTRRGLGVSINAKTVDNMSFRSDRDVLLFDLPINYIPAITQQHTYNLAATLYPYATVISGESSASAEVFYTIPKGTKLGGKYGTNVSLNFAAANGLDTTHLSGADELVYGFERNSWGFGPSKFVRDFNVQISRKESKKFKWKYTFFNLEFNTLATPVTTTFKGIVYADIHVLETQIKTRQRESLRTEFQALFTEQDKGDWATVLAEYTWSPHWFASVIDQYNFGNPSEDARVHYLYGAVGRIDGPHRLSIGYGKRREGIFCIGGVCRAVPASNGFEINFSSSF